MPLMGVEQPVAKPTEPPPSALPSAQGCTSPLVPRHCINSATLNCKNWASPDADSRGMCNECFDALQQQLLMDNGAPERGSVSPPRPQSPDGMRRSPGKSPRPPALPDRMHPRVDLEHLVQQILDSCNQTPVVQDSLSDSLSLSRSHSQLKQVRVQRWPMRPSL